MSLEEYSPSLESDEGLQSQTERSSEKVSEAFKESVKRAAKGVAKTQKDEKKAKKYDFLLAGFLVKIIVDKKYDSLLGATFKAIDHGYSSNFILGILSLVNTEVSSKIREISGKEEIKFSYKSKEKTEFNDKSIDIKVKTRINLWIEDIIDSNTIDYSNIQAKNNLELMEKDDSSISNFTAQVFTFFLHNINIKISKNKALGISGFIIQETKKALKKIDIKEV